MYNLVMMPVAEKAYNKLNPNMRERVKTQIDIIEQNLFSHGTKALARDKAHYYRRVGSLRIIFTINTSERVCNIIAISRRDKAYR